MTLQRMAESEGCGAYGFFKLVSSSLDLLVFAVVYGVIE